MLDRINDTPILETLPARHRAAFPALCAVIDPICEHPDDSALILAPDPALPRDDTARITLAWLRGVPVGCVATWRVADGTHGWVGSLAVAPVARGRGLASALVEAAVEDRDRVDGAAHLLLGTIRVLPDGTLNRGSWHALRRAGFAAVGRLRPRITDLGPRGWQLWPSANADGTIDQVLAARAVPFDPAAA